MQLLMMACIINEDMAFAGWQLVSKKKMKNNFMQIRELLKTFF